MQSGNYMSGNEAVAYIKKETIRIYIKVLKFIVLLIKK